MILFFFFSSRRRHTRCSRDWSSDVCSSDLAISRFAQDLFIKGEVDAVDILFTNFISTLAQKPEVRTLLPVGEIKAVHAELEEGTADGGKLLKGATEFLFEPGADQVLGSLLPHYLNFQVYQIFLEAKASEHSARMVAMKNATDNAQQDRKSVV